jgi:hypothetical protein
MTPENLRLRRIGRKFMLASLGKLIDLKSLGVIVEKHLKEKSFSELVSNPHDIYAHYIEENPHA